MRYARVLLFLIIIGIVTGIVLYFIKRSDTSEVPSKLNDVGGSIKEKFIVPDGLIK